MKNGPDPSGRGHYVNYARRLAPVLDDTTDLPEAKPRLGGRHGSLPPSPTVFYLREENQQLFEENRHLREQVANLKRQVENWQRASEQPEGFIRCAICHVSKPVSAFWRDRSRVRGYRSYCCVCDKLRYPRGGRLR